MYLAHSIGKVAVGVGVGVGVVTEFILSLDQSLPMSTFRMGSGLILILLVVYYFIRMDSSVKC